MLHSVLFHPPPSRRRGGRRWVWSRRMGKTYLSVSCFSYTFRLVWSRMTLMLTKQPRSSFFARNIDILRDGFCGRDQRRRSDVGGDRQKRQDAMSQGMWAAYVHHADLRKQQRPPQYSGLVQRWSCPVAFSMAASTKIAFVISKYSRACRDLRACLNDFFHLPPQKPTVNRQDFEKLNQPSCTARRASRFIPFWLSQNARCLK